MIRFILLAATALALAAATASTTARTSRTPEQVRNDEENGRSALFVPISLA